MYERRMNEKENERSGTENAGPGAEAPRRK
jgi:hypothetical protein